LRPFSEIARQIHGRVSMSNRTFFAELKRRNVYKVVVAYVVVTQE
jgi:hypothetical protein